MTTHLQTFSIIPLRVQIFMYVNFPTPQKCIHPQLQASPFLTVKNDLDKLGSLSSRINFVIFTKLNWNSNESSATDKENPGTNK